MENEAKLEYVFCICMPCAEGSSRNAEPSENEAGPSGNEADRPSGNDADGPGNIADELSGNPANMVDGSGNISLFDDSANMADDSGNMLEDCNSGDESARLRRESRSMISGEEFSAMWTGELGGVNSTGSRPSGVDVDRSLGGDCVSGVEGSRSGGVDGGVDESALHSVVSDSAEGESLRATRGIFLNISVIGRLMSLAGKISGMSSEVPSLRWRSLRCSAGSALNSMDS